MKLKALHTRGILDIGSSGSDEYHLVLALRPGQIVDISDRYRKLQNIDSAINAGLLQILSYDQTNTSDVVQPEVNAKSDGTHNHNLLYSDINHSHLLNDLDDPTSELDLNDQKIIHLAEPTHSTDAVTKNYVDTQDFIVNPMTDFGDVVYGGASGTPTKLEIGSAGKVLTSNGTTPAWDTITEDMLDLSNVDTGNASISRHGFLPILSNNALQYLDGTGNWTVPAGGGGSEPGSYSSTPFTDQTSITVTHNFGVYPAVQVLSNANVVIAPTSITHNSVNDFTVAFGAPTSGTIIATIGSPQPQNVVTVNYNYNISISNKIINCNASGKTMVLNIAANTSTGREFVIDNSSTGDIYLEGIGGDTIQGESQQTIPPDSAIHVYSNGSEWRIY